MESMHSTTTDAAESADPTRLARLRHWMTAVTPTIGTYRGLTAAYILLFAVNLTGLAAAQAGSKICNTPISNTVNKVAPLILAVIVMGGLMMTYILHAWSGVKKDPQKAKEVKDWRNRAGISAASAPLVGKFLEIVIGITGFGLASCIDIIPGF